jgi:DNA-binding CsgD family transcriptional regulator
MSCGLSRRVSSPVLVGRTAQLARLHLVTEQALAGQPTTVVVAGEAGVGKTRLVAELLRHAGERGAVTLTGGCLDVGEGVLVYAPVIEALRGLVGRLDADELDRVLGNARPELARLAPELAAPAPTASSGPDGAPSAPGRFFELLLGVVGRLAEHASVLLVIEDLHWADRSTRELLGFLHRNLRGSVCLVLTYRNDEPGRRPPLHAFLAELERGDRVERLELGRLPREELDELLTGILGHPAPAALAAEIWARSDGNPSFAEELLAAHRAGLADRGLHQALRDMLLVRVEALTEPVQQLLEVAAVAGRRVDHSLLAAVADQPLEELVGLLREAVSHHVLVAEEPRGPTGPDGEGTYAFRHALVQEAVYGGLLPVERRRLHAAYAGALAARLEGAGQAGQAGATDLGQLAHHTYAAHDLEAALPATVRAGQAAEDAYAMPEALSHYERALELWEHVPGAAASSPLDRVGLLARTAHVASVVGDLDRAVALVHRGLGATDPATEPLRAGALLERLAQYHRERGDPAAAMAALEQAVAVIPAVPPSAEQARALAAHGRLLMLQHRDLKQAVSDCDQAIAVARQAGARAEEGRALMTLARLRGELGQFDDGLAHLEQARRIAEDLGNPEDLCDVHHNLVSLLWKRGSSEAAVEAGREGWAVAGRVGMTRSHGVAIAAQAVRALLWLGRFEEAERLLGEALDRDLPPGVLLRSVPERGLLRLRRGDVAAAEADFTFVLDRCRGALESEPGSAWRVFAGLAEAATWDGRLDEARAAAAEGLALVAESDEPSFVIPVAAAGLAAEAERAEGALARHAAAERDDAHQVASALIGVARAAGGKPEAVLTPLTGAELATAEAEWSRVASGSDPARWATAAAAWDGLGFPWPAAYARWRLGEALLAGGAPRDEAAAIVRQAWAAAQELGARRLAQELEALARRGRVELDAAPSAAGSAPERLPPSPAEAAAAEFGLTPRELEVLALVANGQTNRQIAEALFISDKTASVHVSNILAKLGAANRGQAAAAAHRLGLDS